MFEVSDRKVCIFDDFKRTWLLELNPELLILNYHFINLWSLNSCAISLGINRLNLEVCEVLGLDISHDIEIASLSAFGLESILSRLEANQVRRYNRPGSILQH